jgi:hypothetical protein
MIRDGRLPSAKVQVAAAALVLNLAAPATAQEPATPAPAIQEVSAYRSIAHRIVARIVGLENRYPQLKSMASTARTDEADDKLWLAVHFAHDVSRVPNPNFRPGTKTVETINAFASPNAIDMELYFCAGQWSGQATVQPLVIGDMRIVSFIDGRDTPEMASLRRAIRRIVTDEQSRFDKTRPVPERGH